MTPMIQSILHYLMPSMGLSAVSYAVMQAKLRALQAQAVEWGPEPFSGIDMLCFFGAQHAEVSK